MATEFKLPDLGEGIDSAEVARVLVSDGDTVEENQPVIEVEAEKASLEVPTDVAGKVSQVHVKEGDTVKIGQTILSLEGPPAREGGPEETGDGRRKVGARPPEAEKAAKEEPTAAEREKATAGTEGREAAAEEVEGEKPGAERAPEKAEAKAPAAKEEKAERERPAEEEPEREKVRAEAKEAAAEEKPREEQQPAEKQPAAEAAEPTPATGAAEARKASGVPPAEEREPVAAAPSVRQFARDIGVDIAGVTGSGPSGRISIDDVKEYARRRPGRPEHEAKEQAPPARPGAERPPLPDFEKFGRISREPIGSVRRAVARQMSLSWSTIPHVTLFDEADVTALETVREQYKARAEEASAKLTITVIMLKIAAVALKIFPRINASVDMDGGEVIYKQYYHLGVATDTERGLLVPVIRDVDKKGIIQLAVELTQLADRARHGMLSREEMQGGSFTVTSLGGIGTAFFAPIINPPEVAILGLGRIRQQPNVNPETPPRLMLPLSLSIDHRAVDGADGARFLQWIVEAVNQPLMLAMEG